MLPMRLLALRACAMVLLLLAIPLTASADVVEDAELQPDWLHDALDDYWDDQFADADREYEAPDLIFYEDEQETDCGETVEAATPFYCPADNTVYIADSRYEAIVDDRGEAYWVIEVAGVWGTAVVWQLGLSDLDEDEPAQGPEEDPGLQFCLSGAFVSFAVDEDLLDADDVEDALDEIEERFSEDAWEELAAGFDDGLDGCEFDLADLGGADGGDDDDGGGGGGDGNGGDGDVYESPHYGYTITYDTKAWEVYLEDDTPDNPYDQICLTNDISVICVTGDPDYDDDEMDVCLDDYLGGLESGDGVSDIEELDEPDAFGDEDGRAWGSYTYVFENEDGDEFENTRYYECAWIEDGLTIVILHGALSDDYEDEIEAREEFVQGIDTGGSVEDDDDEDDASDDDGDDDEDVDEEPGADDEDGDDEEDDERDVAGGDEAIEIIDFAFSPDELVISVGTTVTWTNGDGVPHTVTADDESFDSGRLDEGESFEFVFDDAGDYEFHCDFHPDMTGTITVE